MNVLSTRGTTRKYAAPEYYDPTLRQNEASAASVDVFAMGLLIWEVWSHSIASENWRDQKETMLQSVPAGLSAIIQQCWAPNPLDRPSINSLLSSLSAFEAESQQSQRIGSKPIGTGPVPCLLSLLAGDAVRCVLRCIRLASLTCSCRLCLRLIGMRSSKSSSTRRS